MNISGANIGPLRGPSFVRTGPAPASATGVGPQGLVTSASPNSTLDFYAYGVQYASLVTFPTWSDVNGQDDIVWYPGTKLVLNCIS